MRNRLLLTILYSTDRTYGLPSTTHIISVGNTFPGDVSPSRCLVLPSLVATFILFLGQYSHLFTGEETGCRILVQSIGRQSKGQRIHRALTDGTGWRLWQLTVNDEPGMLTNVFELFFPSTHPHRFCRGGMFSLIPLSCACCGASSSRWPFIWFLFLFFFTSGWLRCGPDAISHRARKAEQIREKQANIAHWPQLRLSRRALPAPCLSARL